MLAQIAAAVLAAAAGLSSASPVVDRNLIVGTWRFVGDPANVRVFRANGTTCEDDNGGVFRGPGDCGTWSWVPARSDPGLPPGYRGNDPHLKVVVGGGTFYYDVATVDATKLTLVYTPPGRILNYTRVSRPTR